MKKRSLRERKEAFKEAYRSELAKQCIIDAPKPKEPEKAIKTVKKVGEKNGK